MQGRLQNFQRMGAQIKILEQTKFTVKMHKIRDFEKKLGPLVPSLLLRTGAWHPLLHFIIAPALMPPLDHLVCTWLLYETLPVLK